VHRRERCGDARSKERRIILWGISASDIRHQRALGTATAATRATSQVLHRVMPRIEQTTQMNVPQSSHGYPSDARSSLPQARQTIASPAVDVMRAK